MTRDAVSGASAKGSAGGGCGPEPGLNPAETEQAGRRLFPDRGLHPFAGIDPEVQQPVHGVEGLVPIEAITGVEVLEDVLAGGLGKFENGKPGIVTMTVLN